MIEEPLRIAFFPDAFHEVDGVAAVARRFEDFARQRELPFLMVHAGPRDQVLIEKSITRVQLRRSRIRFPLDRAHDFDLLFSRHYRKLARILREFRPDVIQITGPSDVGILGALLAHRLGIPLAAFWQTNLPQYAGMRAAHAVSFLPKPLANLVSRAAQRSSSFATTRFYGIPKLLFAPNPEIASLLAKATGNPCLLMSHGVDTSVFHPDFRDRHTGPFTIGYVGRFSAEKNVRDLARLERALHEMGHKDFRIVLVGEGAEESWLRENVQQAEFSGVLSGTQLSRAFANMDVLAFPSDTDTFGLVVLEALSSGVPAVVTAQGGPKFTVQHGETGYVAQTFEEFAAAVATLMTRSDILATMRRAARQHALSASWSRAFEDIYSAYPDHLPVRAASHSALGMAASSA